MEIVAFSMLSLAMQTNILLSATLMHHKNTLMLEYHIDSIAVELRGRIFQQIIVIPMGTNCAILSSDLFLYLSEIDSMQDLLKADKKTRLAQQ